MLHTLDSELFRLRKRAQTWLMPVIAAAFIALFYGGVYIAYHIGSGDTPGDMAVTAGVDQIFSGGMRIFGFFGAILVVMVASGLIGSEYGWNTLRPLVSRSPSRWTLLSAKFVVVAGYTALMVVVGVITSLIMAATVSILMGNGGSLPLHLWDDYVLGTLRWAIALLPYGVVAFSVALLTRSNAAGIATGIGLRFVEPLLFGLLSLGGEALESVQEFGIGWNVQRLVSLPMSPDATDDAIATADVWQSAGIVGLYVAALIAVTTWVFNRRDITSG